VITHTTIRLSDGRITRLGRSPDIPSSNAEFAVVEGEYPATDYYGVAGVPTPRTPLDVVLSSEHVTLGGTFTLSNLPVPCRVHVDAVYVDVADGILHVTPQSVGEYRVVVDEPAYRAQTWTVTVDD
jgi:hypothetical protein